MRAEFARQDIPCYGAPSPIVPVPIGTEAQSRLAHRLLTERGIAAMIIEYPLVAIGAARFRLQAMATHSIEEAVLAAKVIGQTVKEVHGATGGHSRSIAS
jgi:glycine C-acetyltransferase